MTWDRGIISLPWGRAPENDNRSFILEILAMQSTGSDYRGQKAAGRALRWLDPTAVTVQTRDRIIRHTGRTSWRRSRSGGDRRGVGCAECDINGATHRFDLSSGGHDWAWLRKS